MNKVLIAGTGMTHFGKQIGRGLRSMAVAAIDEALADAGIPYGDVSRIFFGNAAAGIVSQQELIRGQVDVAYHPAGAAPLINIANAWTSGGSPLNLADITIMAGLEEDVRVSGVSRRITET